MNAGYMLHSLSVQVGNWWPFEFVQLHDEDNYEVLFVVMREPAYENMLLRARHCHSTTEHREHHYSKISNELTFPFSEQNLLLFSGCLCWIVIFNSLIGHKPCISQPTPVSPFKSSSFRDPFQGMTALSCIFLLLCRSTTLKAAFLLGGKSFALGPLLHSPSLPNVLYFP